MAAPPVALPEDNDPIVPKKRAEASFSQVEEEALQKAPFSWEFRTALIGMTFTIPVFLMLLFAGNFNFFGFSLSLMLIGLLCGLGFRFFSHPWSFPITSLFTSLFTMALAEAILTTQIGAEAAGLHPFPYFIAVLTINPLDVIMDTMTHMMTSARGLIVGLITAFWLGCND